MAENEVKKRINYDLLKKGGFMRQKQKGYFSLRLQVVGAILSLGTSIISESRVSADLVLEPLPHVRETRSAPAAVSIPRNWRVN